MPLRTAASRFDREKQRKAGVVVFFHPNLTCSQHAGSESPWLSFVISTNHQHLSKVGRKLQVVLQVNGEGEHAGAEKTEVCGYNRASSVWQAAEACKAIRY